MMNKLETFEIKPIAATVHYSEELYKSINGRIDKKMRDAATLRQLGNYGVILHAIAKVKLLGGRALTLN